MRDFCATLEKVKEIETECFCSCNSGVLHSDTLVLVTTCLYASCNKGIMSVCSEMKVNFCHRTTEHVSG